MVKLKINTQVRRILALAGVMCVLVCALAPAASAAVTQTRYFPIPLDFTACDEVAGPEPFPYWIPFGLGEQSPNSGLPAVMRFPDNGAPTWVMDSREQYSASIQQNYTFANPFPDYGTWLSFRTDEFVFRANLDGSRQYLNIGDRYWNEDCYFEMSGKIVALNSGLSTVEYAFEGVYSNSRSCDLVNMLQKAVNLSKAPQSVKDNQLWLIRDLRITVYLKNTYDQFELSITGSGAGRASVADWVRQFKYYAPSTDIGDANFVSWLSGAIGDIFEIELWPGFSLNDLFNVVLIIGLVFWFMKLTV